MEQLPDSEHYAYMIFCSVNGKIYVGQTRYPRKRWREHMVSSHNPHLRNAVNAYGESQFSFHILTTCSIQDIDAAEIYWVRFFNSADRMCGYNIEKGGNAVNKIVSEETRAKMSAAQKGRTLSKEHRDKLSLVQKGKVISEETRAKMSVARTGEKNHMFGKRGADSPSSKRIGPLNPMFGRKSEDNPSAKLTFDIAQKIREEYKGGLMSSRQLAVKYGVSKTTILSVIRGKAYKE